MKISRKLIVAIISSILLLMLFVNSCGGPTYKGYSGSNKGNTLKASYDLFNGKEEKKIYVPLSYELVFNYATVAEEGSLKVQLFTPEKDLLADFEPNTSGSHVYLADAGDFSLVITGNNTKGSYDFSWGLLYFRDE
jgi:hypothetical protein